MKKKIIQYCEDCEHCCIDEDGIRFSKCKARIDSVGDTLVSRQFIEPEYLYCSTVRHNGKDTCKLFKPIGE